MAQCHADEWNEVVAQRVQSPPKRTQIRNASTKSAQSFVTACWHHRGRESQWHAGGTPKFEILEDSGEQLAGKRARSSMLVYRRA